MNVGAVMWILDAATVVHYWDYYGVIKVGEASRVGNVGDTEEKNHLS